ncbi:uncharacterized protein LOC113303634 [Papaver somniferum]|uniref:uncharacterized protein LOC113303634 n=1 Tax=Papaver somniferum TaxID=3469 RepID=UPI000E6F5B07|nr:uncharacterized protein LOC113303634 [Papaver somniferum]
MSRWFLGYGYGFMIGLVVPLEVILVNGVTEILNTLLPLIYQQVRQAWDVKDDLRKLGKSLESIQALVSDTEEKQITDATVRLWLRRLTTSVVDDSELIGREDAVSDIIKMMTVKRFPSAVGIPAQVDRNTLRNKNEIKCLICCLYVCFGLSRL